MWEICEHEFWKLIAASNRNVFQPCFFQALEFFSGPIDFFSVLLHSSFVLLPLVEDTGLAGEELSGPVVRDPETAC